MLSGHPVIYAFDLLMPSALRQPPASLHFDDDDDGDDTWTVEVGSHSLGRARETHVLLGWFS